MKSLILKDIYNIMHNMKALVLMLFIFLFITIPQGGAAAYVITCCILCAMMVVTTFSFDENAKWEKYAMIMPISRKDLVLSKFVILLCFCLFGTVFGGVLGIAGSAIIGRFHITSASEWQELLAVCLAGVAISFFLGSLVIPLLFKFGAEKARTLMLAAFLLPVLLCLGLYYLLRSFGIELTDSVVLLLTCISPLVLLLWTAAMYRISFGIFKKSRILTYHIPRKPAVFYRLSGDFFNSEIFCRNTGSTGFHGLRRSLKNHESALFPAFRPKVDHPVTVSDELLVMLHHNDSIPGICQPF